MSSARNLGMAEAKGTYLAFADSDDWLASDALETLYGALKAAGADTAGGATTGWRWTAARRRRPAHFLPGSMAPGDPTGIIDRLLGKRMGKPGQVLNGFIWRFLFSREIIQRQTITFAGAYLEDELFLMEYFCYAQKAGHGGPAGVLLSPEPRLCHPAVPAGIYADLPELYESQRGPGPAPGPGDNLPLWRENSYWSGLLIAIGNEFAASNAASLAEKRRRIRGICQLPAMAQAIQAIHPQGLGRNKQMVADLVRRRQFFLLSVLYGLKNRK